MYCGDEVGAFIGDVGSLTAKFGYAGEDTPNLVFPSCMGVRPATNERIVGHSALSSCHDITALPRAISTMEDKINYNWDVMEKLWLHAFEESHVDPTQHAVLTSLSPFDMHESVSYMELMFEKFNVPAFYVAKDAVLNAFSFGKSTALVCDVGASSTRVVPVVEGFNLKGSSFRSTVGGEALTAQLLSVLQEKHHIEIHPGVRKYPAAGDGSGPALLRPLASVSNEYRNFRILEIVRDIKESLCQMPETTLQEDLVESVAPEHYELPDGQVVTLGSERFRIPEKLFHPDVIAADSTTVDSASKGLHRMVYNAVQGSDVDVRKDLLNNLVLCGGGSSLPGLTERLHWEVSKLVPSATYKVRLTQVSSIEKKFSAWIGGSILASLGSFQQLWVSKREYDEYGADAMATSRFLLTLSFKVPSSIKLPQSTSILRVVVPPVEALDESGEGRVDDDDEDDWECKTDFKIDLNGPLLRDDDCNSDWEGEDEVESFPDDFPILLVNLSKLSVEHMGVELTTNEDASRISDTMQEIFASPKFSYVLEVLLEQETAYHATYGAYKARLAQLTKVGSDVWAAIDYPALVDDDIPLSDILAVLRRPTKWRSVNYIKDCMAQTSRDIKWKAQVIAELEKLAETEDAARNARQEALRVDIEQLAAARDAYDRKLDSLDGLHDTKSVMARRFATSRLEETNASLSRLVDAYVATSAPSTSSASERRSDVEVPAGQAMQEMNVVDMVVSMIFSRLPRHPSTSMESHYKSLMDSHAHIRMLWVDDFGRLPPKSRPVVDDDDYSQGHEEVAVASFPPVTSSDTFAEKVEPPRPDSKSEHMDVKVSSADSEDPAVISRTSQRRSKQVPKKPSSRSTKSSSTKSTFRPMACVGALSLLQASNDDDSHYLFE
ncbi:hypothetical protein DYB30_000682 [Aphanomyces astaci]|uniref:Uncharacterized protein n=1 Tax=Aphanomyces astaci TaxID=112090 RepID=A0A397E6I2_APHAT|nr:hypothetical protein DYB34_002394 [Aphanomyces astaci]RHY77267.1 hypothetical protein DYB30_000682 [Aphanomyces astaci]